MLAAVISRFGPPDVLEIRDVPTPAPGPDEVLVRVHASSLNRADLAQRLGRYPAPPGWPADIPGLEFAGQVAATGSDARRWHAGDRVFGLVGGGAHAEYVVVHEATIARIPDTLTWHEAAAIPEAFLTAYDAMITQGAMRAGDRVLVHAVASGVGLAAVQVARAWGGRAFGTSRRADKLTVARSLGMEDGIALPDGPAPLVAAVKAWSENHGADVVVDLVGGSYVGASVDAAAYRARLLLIGAVGGSDARFDVRQALFKRLTIQGTVMRARSLAERIAVAEVFASEIVPRVANGSLIPTIDEVYPIARIAEAHARLESNDTAGKLVIELPPR
ncbi:MAG: NAD(P)H-quinone oxidoreductase [Gemmatimonadetes bacterium]|nr:NAD(P)H-quinone oxidoreductase [Gemmatimonadota bacterium]MBK8058045.1 NAD(P)H-quinone oxidoreductase [Gemmatimonadota bacterium]MBK9980175.1 NAD(P)H-quinone oxidoreductase [Gemmatimonadota bacterium]